MLRGTTSTAGAHRRLFGTDRFNGPGKAVGV